VTTPLWRVLAFGDLHVSARTLTRALEVLRRIRQVVSAHPCLVVCTGDFWDKRGTLAVRQVDAIMNEMDLWKKAGISLIMVPGNHDQVSRDGSIHGVRVFDPFSNITIATERFLIHSDRIAFIPWREDSQDQAEMFATLPGAPDWTIFGHAEVRGALTNNGQPSPGRVTLAQIQSTARACYLGHYHARQQLGDRTWYIGSPFEMNFGERGMSHGVAIVDSTSIAPQFIDLDDFPKHHRIDLRSPEPTPAVRSNDIVELIGTREQLRAPSISTWLAVVPGLDVRQRPVREEATDAPPPLAWTLRDAVREYAGGDADRIVAAEQLLEGATDTVEPWGTETRILDIAGSNFCALRGPFKMDLGGQGAILLRGPIGTGKTSLTDAITWALYDVTAPRRAAGDTASLRGDEVIHDDAERTSVTVRIEVRHDDVPEVWAVTRVKRRGRGSVVDVRGPIERPDGIADDNEWIARLVGLPHALWRACVSLGQGPVANFLTGSDKARKALLTDAYGLEACAPTQAEARKRAKAAEQTIQRLQTDRHSAEKLLAHIEAQDFGAEDARWKAVNTERIARAASTIADAQLKIGEADAALTRYETTQQARDQVEDQIIEIERKLDKAQPSAVHAAAQRTLGSLQAERSMAERDLSNLRTAYETMVAAAQQGVSTCPACRQPIPRGDVEAHLVEQEARIRAKAADIEMLSTRFAQTAMQLEGLEGPAASAAERLRHDIAPLRAQKVTLEKALAQFARIIAARDVLRARLAAAEGDRDAAARDASPWERKAAEQQAQAQAQRDALTTLDAALKARTTEATTWQFWVEGFGPKGLPVVVLRTVLSDLEQTANEFLGRLVEGRIWAELSLADDALDVLFHKYDPESKMWRARRLEQLSTGERRCAELAFSPFGLSTMLFKRLRCRVPFLVIDELTTHLGQDEKAIACDILRSLDRETILVIDHDQNVQDEFDVVYDLNSTPDGVIFERTR